MVVTRKKKNQVTKANKRSKTSEPQKTSPQKSSPHQEGSSKELHKTTKNKNLLNNSPPSPSSSQKSVLEYFQPRNNSSSCSSPVPSKKKKMTRNNDSDHQPTEQTSRDTPSPISVEEMCVKMSLDEFHYNTNIVELIKEYFQKQNHPKELLAKMLRMIDTYVNRVYTRYMEKPEYRKDELFLNLKILPKPIEISDVESNRSDSSQFSHVSNKRKCTSPKGKQMETTNNSLEANNLQLKSQRNKKPVLQQKDLNAKENKIHNSNYPPPQEGCSKWFDGSQTASEERANTKSVNDAQKLLICNQKESYIPPKGIEEVCIKMSLKEFRENTNIVELIKDYFMKQNHPKDLLKKMLDSIDAYVGRVYNRYIRKPTYRQDDLFKNLKIISRITWDQSQSESVGTDLSTSTQSTVVTKIARPAVCQLDSLKGSTNKTSSNGKDITAHNLSELGASPEAQITNLGVNVRDKPCPLSKKVIKTSVGLSTNVQLKSQQSKEPVPQQQDLNAKENKANNSHYPLPQEGCSKWFYDSQTTSEKRTDKSENNTQKLLLCNQKESYISPKGIEEMCLKMSLKEFRDNTNIVELIKDYFIKQNHPNDLLKKMLDSIDAYVERVYNRYIRKPTYRQDDLFKNLKIISRMAWNQSQFSTSSQSTVVTKIARPAVPLKEATNQINSNGKNIITDNLSKLNACAEPQIQKLGDAIRERPCPLSKKGIKRSEGLSANKIINEEQQLPPIKRKCASIDSDDIEDDYFLLQSSKNSDTTETVESGPTSKPCTVGAKNQQKTQKCIKVTFSGPLSKKNKQVEQVDSENNAGSVIPECSVLICPTTDAKPQPPDVSDKIHFNRTNNVADVNQKNDQDCNFKVKNTSFQPQDKSGESVRKMALSLQKPVKKSTDLQNTNENNNQDETILFLPKKRKCAIIYEEDTEEESSSMTSFKNVDEPTKNITSNNTRPINSASTSKVVVLERPCTLIANQQQNKRNDLVDDVSCPLSKKIKQVVAAPCRNTAKNNEENTAKNTRDKEQNNEKNAQYTEQGEIKINHENKVHKPPERPNFPQEEATLLKSTLISPNKQPCSPQNNKDPNKIIQTITTDHKKDRICLVKSPIKYTSIGPKRIITTSLLGKLIQSLAKDQQSLNNAVSSNPTAVIANCNTSAQSNNHEAISPKQSNVFLTNKQLVNNEYTIADNALNDTTISSKFLNSTVIENTTNVHHVAMVHNDVEISSHELNEVVQDNHANPTEIDENEIVVKEEMNCTCHSDYDDDVEFLPQTPQKQIVIHDTPTDTEEMFHRMMNPILNDYHETIVDYHMDIAANVDVGTVVQDEITLFVTSDEKANSQDDGMTSTPVLISSGSTDEVPPTPEQLEQNFLEKNQPNNIHVQHIFVLPDKIQNISSPKNVSSPPVILTIPKPQHKFVKPLTVTKARKRLNRFNLISFNENDGRDFLIEEDSSPESSPNNLQPINASPPDPMPPTNSQLLNEDETYFRNATICSQKEQTMATDDKSHDADAPVKLMPDVNPICEASVVASKVSIIEHRQPAQPSTRAVVNGAYLPRSIKCRNYTCLTYVDIRSVSFEREVNRICYESNQPFMELQEEKQVKATIKVNFDRCKSLHIHGDTLRILLGLTSREWKCVMKLFKAIEVFDYKSSDSEPTSRSLPYRLLYHLFKTLPRFSQAVLQCDPTSAYDEVKCVEMKVEYFKPVQTLSQAFKPFILEKMKQLKLNLNNM